MERGSVADLLQHLSSTVDGVEIQVDPSVQQSGTDLATRVFTMQVKELSLAAVLERALSYGLTYTVEGSTIRVMTREKWLQQLPEHPHSIPQGMLRHLARGGKAQLVSQLSVLSQLIMRAVSSQSSREVAPWAEEGGHANLSLKNTQFIVTQTLEGHRRIHNFLEMLTLAMAGRRPPPTDQMKQIAAMRRRLKQKVNLNCAGTPLIKALQQLGQKCPDLKLVVSPSLAAHGIDLSSRTVDLNVKATPVENVLDLILGKKLTYVVKPESVIITLHVTGFFSDLSLRCYPVQRLIGRGPNAQRRAFSLRDFVQRTVNSQRDPAVAFWVEEGGTGVLQVFEGVLVVTQTAKGHERVEDCLKRFRP